MLLLANNWWAFVLRGVFAVLFGILALIWPGSALYVLVILFGAYAIIDGIFAVVAALSGGVGRRWGLLLEGVLGIIAGIVAFAWPGITALALLYVIAAWALVTGIFEIVTAISLRRVITNEWALVLAGIASIIFALILFVFPGAGALAVIWVIATYAIVFGILLIVLGLRLRGLQDRASSSAT